MAAAATLSLNEARQILRKAGYYVRFKIVKSRYGIGHNLFVYPDGVTLQQVKREEVVKALGFYPSNFLPDVSSTFYVHNQQDMAGTEKLRQLRDKIHGGLK